MTSMRRHHVASTSLRRHVPAGNLAPLGPPPNSKPWPAQYSKPSYAYVKKGLLSKELPLIEKKGKMQRLFSWKSSHVFKHRSKYSRLSLSRNRRDRHKQFEISVLRHIRFVVLRKTQFEQPNFTNDYVI